MRLKHLLWVGGLTLLAWSAAVVGMTWHLYTRWEAEVRLQGQRLALQLPAGLAARAEVTSRVRARLDAEPEIGVSIDQRIPVHVLQTLRGTAAVRTTVPIDTTVDYEGQVPVRTVVDAEVPLVSWLPPAKVSVPVELTVPVRLAVPVRVQLPLDLRLDVRGQLAEAVPVPVRAGLRLRVPLHGVVALDVRNRADFSLLGPVAPFELTIRRAELRAGFGDLGLNRAAREP